ncbi:MAG: Hpt domain-containing protein, partial [Methylococcales bacterium]|nr:Hpt domain-containing protein [Methylococcales bacterium]
MQIEQLEDTPNDSDTINSVFRAMHTIKGSSGLFGFDHIVAFTHEAETVLDQVRVGDRAIDAHFISTLLSCRDHTLKLLNFCFANPESELPEDLQQSGIKLVEQLTGKTSEQYLPVTTEQQSIEVDAKGGEISANNWLISLDFQQDALRNGMDPLSFIRYLKTLGEIEQIITHAPGLPAGDEMDPESCYLQFRILFKSDTDKQTIEEVFEFASDDCDIKILPPDSKIEHYLNLLEEQPDTQVERLGEMLIKTGAITKNDINKALQSQKVINEESSDTVKPLGEILVEQQVIQQPVVEQALKIQQQTKQKLAKEASYIRVD